jgi:hypothetical protein
LDEWDTAVTREHGELYGLLGCDFADGGPHPGTLRGMDGVVAFFAGFAPQDWVTGGIAALALAFSVASYRQQERHLPVPVLVARATLSNTTDGLSGRMRVKVSNVGPSPAFDVSLRVRLVPAAAYARRFRNFWVAIESVAKLDSGDSPLEAELASDPQWDFKRVRVTWRQGPNPRRVRSVSVVPQQSWLHVKE